MSSAAPFTPSDDAPAFVRAFGVIMATLGAIIARRFLKDPKLVLLILPLHRWLNKSVRRLERALLRRTVARPSRAGQKQAERKKPRVRLPGMRGWLVRVLGYEAMPAKLQLAALMAGPEMQAALAASPGVGRLLRPICRMLGVADVTKASPDVPGPARRRRMRASAEPAVAEPAVAETEVTPRKRAPRPEVWEPGRAALRAANPPWMFRTLAKRNLR